ncbi:hypothetical protein CGZ80_04960 [Rhodopirellula sp. MGV]|nr:hypothetical protein CGZ80_04960 [Rhodopirellula sp. MGV]PNY37883.1 hypothetical protein C2E31_05095 [Rhodopirellula baltica]
MLFLHSSADVRVDWLGNNDFGNCSNDEIQTLLSPIPGMSVDIPCKAASALRSGARRLARVGYQAEVTSGTDRTAAKTLTKLFAPTARIINMLRQGLS